jgi:hypothetical protein
VQRRAIASRASRRRGQLQWPLAQGDLVLDYSLGLSARNQSMEVEKNSINSIGSLAADLGLKFVNDGDHEDTD